MNFDVCETHILIMITDFYALEASMLTILLLNPNIKTLWNKRRSLIQDKKSQPEFELHFIKLVLTYKPKAQDALNYRKWLLNEHKGIKKLDILISSNPLLMHCNQLQKY